MDAAAISRHLTEAFEGVEVTESWGTLFYYVRPSNPPTPHDSYFATIKTSDDDYDNACCRRPTNGPPSAWRSAYVARQAEALTTYLISWNLCP